MKAAFPYLEIGNLSLVAVSNAGRTRATSHPCERGAGFLQNRQGPASQILDAYARTNFRGGV